MKNNFRKCILYLKEKQIRNTSVQQNQFHKNNMNVISSINLFSMFSILRKPNTKYNLSYKN